MDHGISSIFNTRKKKERSSYNKSPLQSRLLIFYDGISFTNWHLNKAVKNVNFFSLVDFG